MSSYSIISTLFLGLDLFSKQESLEIIERYLALPEKDFARGISCYEQIPRKNMTN